NYTIPARLRPLATPISLPRPFCNARRVSALIFEIRKLPLSSVFCDLGTTPGEVPADQMWLPSGCLHDVGIRCALWSTQQAEHLLLFGGCALGIRFLISSCFRSRLPFAMVISSP